MESRLLLLTISHEMEIYRSTARTSGSEISLTSQTSTTCSSVSSKSCSSCFIIHSLIASKSSSLLLFRALKHAKDDEGKSFPLSLTKQQECDAITKVLFTTDTCTTSFFSLAASFGMLSFCFSQELLLRVLLVGEIQVGGGKLV